MKITRKIYLLLVAFVVSQAMAAQTVLTGKVLEKASGEPLAGASVFVQNKDERTLASVLVDANGEYRIKIPDEQNLVINFSVYRYAELYRKIYRTKGLECIPFRR